MRRLIDSGLAPVPMALLLLSSIAGCMDRSPLVSPERPDVVRLEHATFRLDGSETPPSDELNWSEIELPDLWSEQRPEAEGSGWYRFELGAVATDQTFAIFVPKVNMNAAVFINGHWVGDGGTFEPPVAQNWNRPLYYSFPPELLLPTDNVVHIRIWAYANDWGGLYPVYAGPHAQLRTRAAAQHTWQITLSQAASLLVLFLALMIGAMGQAGSVYRYWACGCLLYFVHSLSAYVTDIGMPYSLGRWLIHTSFDLHALLLVLGVSVWANMKHPRFERAMTVVMLLGAVVSFCVPDRWFLPVANVLHILPVVFSAYGLWIVLTQFRKLEGHEGSVLVVGSMIAMGLGLHALLISFGVLPQDEPRLLKLMAPLLMLSFGGVLAGRYIRAAREAKMLNAELSARVTEKEEELRIHFEHVREMEGQQILMEERSRLMREMHDGMGGRLISLLAMTEDENEDKSLDRKALRTTVKEALEEMRFIIDSLDPDIDDVGILLGVVRERMEPRLGSHGLKFRWRVGEQPPDLCLRPEQSLDILRFVQECLTNVIKHANASVIELGTQLESDPEPKLVVFIGDDGVGFDSSSVERGRGLKNLRERAKRLGGEIRVQSGDSGTRIELVLQLSFWT